MTYHTRNYPRRHHRSHTKRTRLRSSIPHGHVATLTRRYHRRHSQYGKCTTPRRIRHGGRHRNYHGNGVNNYRTSNANRELSFLWGFPSLIRVNRRFRNANNEYTLNGRPIRVRSRIYRLRTLLRRTLNNTPRLAILRHFRLIRR